jgi:hypothetical protein
MTVPVPSWHASLTKVSLVVTEQFRRLNAVTTYSREDDLVVALQEATKVMAGELFAEIAHTQGRSAAAQAVIDIAQAYVRWLRRPVYVRLEFQGIEEQDGTPPTATTAEGAEVTTIDTSQQARYVIDAADDRGFPVDSTFTATATPDGVVTATVIEATTGTASGKDELVVVAVAPGSAVVTITNTDNPAIFGSDAVDVVPGGVATVTLSAAVVEEQPAPPAPEPAPEPTV